MNPDCMKQRVLVDFFSKHGSVHVVKQRELLNEKRERVISSESKIHFLAAGLQDTRDNCWAFFTERVRRQLKVVLCFSPVGNTLRIRSRKFPAITNCTAIDWFHEWPEEALVSVSKRFLEETEQVLVSFLYLR